MHGNRDIATRCLAELLQADERLHAYILIDPMLREPLVAQLLDDCEATIEPVPVRHPSLREGQRPRLVSLRPQAVDLLEASLRAAESEQADPNREANVGFAVGGWLLSTASISEVAHHLARVMGACLVQGVGRRYVRLADRRVLEWLWPMLDPEQRLSLLGPVSSWVALDRGGQPISRSRDQIEVAARAATPFALTAEQWARMQKCELIQAMLRGWRQFATVLPPAYLTQAAQAVEAAQAMGLSNQRDILLLGAYQLQVHSRLCTHPRIIQAVTQATRDQTPLFEVLGSIPDPDGWDEIRQQLEHSGASARSNALVRA